MKSIVFLFSFLFSTFIYAQNIERPKQTKEKERLRKTLNSKIAEAKGEFDPASYKYAILFAENPPIVEIQEKYQKYQKYFAEYGKLLPLEETLPEDGVLFNEIGEVFFGFNKYTLAEDAFNNALKILERYNQQKSTDYAMTLNNLALLYISSGRYTKAAIVGEQSRALHEDILPKESSPMAMSLNNLGVLYAKLGMFEEAEEFISEASRINEKALTRRSVAYALSINNMGMLMHAKGIEDEAEEMLIESQRLSKDILKESSISYRRIMLNLVSMYNDIGRYQDAEVMCLKLIKLTENRVGAVHPDQATLQNLLGMIYMNPAYNKKQEAEEAFKKAIAFVRKGLGDRDIMVVRPGVNLGNLYRTEGKLPEAELILANVVDVGAELLYETDEDYISALESIGLLNWQRKRNIEAGKFLKSAVQANLKALENMFGFGSEPERNHYLSTLDYNLENFYAFTVSNSKSSLSLGADALNYNLSTAVLSNGGNRKNHNEIVGQDSKYKEDFLTWIDLKEKLSWLYSTSKKYILDEGLNVEVLEKDVITIGKTLPAEYKNFNKDYVPKFSDVRTIHQTLGKDEAIVAILKFPKFNKGLTDSVDYGAFVLTKENASPKVIRIKGSDLLEKEYFQSYKKRLILKEKDEQSFQNYWGAIDESLKEKKEIFLYTEGIYNLINVKTLLKPTGSFVNQLYKIVQFASLNHLVNYKSKKAPSTMHKALLAGFPDYGPKGIIPQLPGSLSEVESIKGLLDSNKIIADVLLQKEATEQTIKSKEVFDILHLATHASITSKRRGFNDKSFIKKSDLFYVDELSSSGIFLSGAEKVLKDQWQDGILTGKEIQQLKFSTGSLIVLSQVDTWKQDVNYDDLANLQHAFKEAGGKSILQTLWKTEDAIKLEFLINFYQTYLTTKDSQKAYEVAVRMVSLKYPNPYDWGAFILIN